MSCSAPRFELLYVQKPLLDAKECMHDLHLESRNFALPSVARCRVQGDACSLLCDTSGWTCTQEGVTNQILHSLSVSHVSV